MSDNDKSGRFARRARVYGGPTLGWHMVDIEPERFISTSPVTVGSGDSVILLTGTAQTINLPDVTQWVLQSADNPNARPAFDRGLEIVDFGGLASDASRHTIVPYGTQTIMGLAQWQIISAFVGVILRPLSTLTGWYAR